MKHQIKTLIGHSLFAAGLDRWLLSNAAVVVCFHRVRPDASDSLTVTPAAFELYCRFFKDNLDIVPLRDLVAALEAGRSIPSGLSITFDDGYRDNFEYAAPILTKMALPATFFVITQWMGTDVVAWWDKDRPLSHPWMTWDHIRALHDVGFEIGAHTRHHADLGKIAEDEARNEIVGSREELERCVGARVESFAYPYGRQGNLSETNRAIVREAGFRCCCSAFGGVNTPGTDPFRLLRIAVTSKMSSPHGFGFDVALGRTVVSAG
jgi:peptidoglycan/xylan/chitin deacetylase (PgdA/CDA1 family)